MVRVILVILAALCSGCAMHVSGYGLTYSAAWGNGQVHCSSDENGYPTGPDCTAGGELSEQAADLASDAIDAKAEATKAEAKAKADAKK